MAADPKPDWLCCLPSSWSYGVTRDGRIFFINEEAKSTTWLHPVTGEAVITGHRKTPDLPTGWEEGYTFEGARCFIKYLKGVACIWLEILVVVLLEDETPTQLKVLFNLQQVFFQDCSGFSSIHLPISSDKLPCF
ncbi:pleckstrin homology domain-containing family A member 5 isoform X12 [Poecilia formosa]|uniref:pleckstrin homology domain-containing family A member 5 isoform X12 n=1 Tax=Poecilia formosa TaxID=48698 RepID=UPI00044423D5|nr:PREDICTED: pleckstrin homology domain-containing family A member 5 isoform X12 [Poecilia formosa]